MRRHSDHSFSHHDCLPYYLRTGDKWHKIDYRKHPETWMKPLEKGPETGLVEIPANWYLDDLPPMSTPFRSSSFLIPFSVSRDMTQGYLPFIYPEMFSCESLDISYWQS